MNRNVCEEVLRRALKHEQGTQLGYFELRPVPDNPGFMGDPQVLHIIYEQNGFIKECTFFLKQVPKCERVWKYVINEGLFNKEKEIYEKIVPMFCKYFLNFTKLHIAPDCYYIQDKEFMILENLTELGYKVHNQLNALDLEHCLIVVKTLAQFHAGSIITEYNTCKQMSEFIEYGHEVYLVKDHHQSLAGFWQTSSFESIYRMLKKIGNYHERLGKNWEMFYIKLKEARDKCIDLIEKPSDKFRNVVCHRDLWFNNIMFKYDDFGKPIGAALIDFQFFRYCPPAFDLSMFLYLTITRQFRDQHLFKLLLTYHKELSTILTEAGIEPESSHGLHLNELLISFEEYRFFGIVIALRYLPICLRTNEDTGLVKQRMTVTPSLDCEENIFLEEFLQQETELLLNNMQSNSELRNRVTSAIDELLDWIRL